MASIPAQLEVRDLGQMAYGQALTLQRQLQQEVITAREGGPSHPGFLLMVEHVPPVITISRRAESGNHLIATPDMLERAGIEVHETDRGGDITYHGPGQLVVYPILDLNELSLRLHGYMRWLEDLVLEVLKQFGIEGHRDCEATGVWVDGPNDHDRKICAMGVRVSRWVSMHGLALNVDPDLSHFDLIVPCGLHGRGVTSLRQELGEQSPSMDVVKKAVASVFEDAVRSEA
ncbi:MAG: lipoyl(octanoyl) transferase LipB [Phycisphaerales bacterium]|nr:lipoyl(octanoyl) transferase LipB [Phycisphaerales bacterium]